MWSSTRVTPLGRAPVSVRDGAGAPEVVTVKDPGDPAVKLAELAEVIVGPWLMFKVKAWVAGPDPPLVAVRVR